MWAQNDPTFQAEFADLLKNYAGRPTALTLCRNSTKGTKLNFILNVKIYYTVVHKTNQVLGKFYWLNVWSKTRIIAETVAGNTAWQQLACAMLDMPCRVYMGGKRC